MIEPQEYQYAEQFRLFSKRYPLDFATYIPFSWSEHLINNTKTEMNVSFKKVLGESITGIMSIKALLVDESQKQFSKDDILQKFLYQYVEMGLDLHKFQSNASESNELSMIFSGSSDFQSSQQGQEAELNVMVFVGRRKNSLFYVDMLGPSKKQFFEAWAINKRTIDILLKNLRIL